MTNNWYPNWTGYAGNKRKQIDTIMALVPDGRNRFLDLFGGTGIVGVQAYQQGKCQEVIYNDADYELMLFLKTVHEMKEDFADEYYKVVEGIFAPDNHNRLSREEAKKKYKQVQARYNGSRFCFWRDDRKKDRKVVENRIKIMRELGGRFQLPRILKRA